MKPIGDPYVKGPTSNPPTKAELIKLVDKYGERTKESTTDGFSVSNVVLVLGVIILFLVVITLWKKKKNLKK